MTQIKFDDLARAVAQGGDHRTTRRSLLQLLGFGSAAGLAAAVAPGWANDAGAALQDATPAATPATQVSVQPSIDVVTIAQKASELLYDVDAIFDYVATEVHYDAYSGALRGDRGTLWSMAGNSVDQSILLAALLKEALFDVRFATGPLDDATSQQLLDSLTIDHDALLNQDLRAQFANMTVDGVSVLEATPTTSTTMAQTTMVALTPEQQAEFDKATAAKDAQVAEAEKQLSASLKLITDALASKNISLPDAAVPALPDRERQQHVWVQYASGTEWIDLDPSMPNAEAGKAYATAEQTVVELPPDLDHIVRFRLVKEYVGGGAPQRQDVMAVEHKARDLVGVPVTLMHVPPSAFEALGQAIAGLVEGTTNYVPTFFVGEEVVTANQPLQFGTGSSDLFGDALGGDESGDDTPIEGDTLAEWLITEIVTPDGALDPIEREIFDRVGIAKRAEVAASGTPLDLTSIPPVELVNVPEAGNVYPPMLGIFGLSVIGSQVPSWLFDPARTNVDDLTNISLALHGYHMVRDRLAIEALVPKGYRYFNDAPNVASYVFWPEEVTAGQEPTFTVEADLIHRSAGVLPIADLSAEANSGVLAGVLAHVAERISLETTGWASEYELVLPETPPAALSVGRVFEEASAQNIATSVLQPSSAEADLASLSVSEQAASRIKQALEAGFVVIVPESSVTIHGTPVSGWWQVDPDTGYTIDSMENGRGNVALSGVSLLASAPEYTGLLGMVMRAYSALKKLSCLAAVLAIVSGILFSVGAVQAGLANAGGLANYAGGVVGSLSGFYAAMAAGGCGAAGAGLTPNFA